MKAVKYIILYLIIIQFALGYFIPLDMVYGYRIDYSLVKDNLHNINTILEQIKLEIEKKNLQDYVIILGDSVAFSGPGGSQQSIGYYMEEIAQDIYGDKAPKIFNLAMPAMQTGDIYTMLLKLDKYDISTENLIFNVTYAGFVQRKPDPPIVFWLKDDLKKLDQESFDDVASNLKENDYSKKKDILAKVQGFFLNEVYPQITLFKYKDFLKGELKHIKNQDDALGDARPWYEKEGLKELLLQPEYQKGFSAEPFDMGVNNPQIYFLEKIFQHQQDKNNLVFLAGTNDELMKDKVLKPEYQDNIKRIDKYFQRKDIKYINFQGKISQENFSDHIHLTSEGYRKMAQILSDAFFR